MFVRILGFGALGLCLSSAAWAAPTVRACAAGDDVPAGYAGAAQPNLAGSPPFTGYVQLFWSSAWDVQAWVYNDSAHPERLIVRMLSNGTKKCSVVDDAAHDLRMLDVRTGNQNDTITLEHETTGAAISRPPGNNNAAIHVVAQARGGSDTLATAMSGGSTDVCQYLVGGAGADSTIRGYTNVNCGIGGSMAAIAAPAGATERDNFEAWCDATAGGPTTVDGIDNIELRGSAAQIAFGCEGADKLIGGDGNDVLWGDLGEDTGDDLLSAVTPPTGSDAWDDQLIGDDGDDLMNGEWGEDVLHGDAGDDTLDGYTGDDEFFCGMGDDTVTAGDGADEVWGSDGADIVDGGPGNDRLHGNDGDDSLHGGDDNDTLCGGGQFDAYDGGGGENKLYHPVLSDPPTGSDIPDASDAGAGASNRCSNFSYDLGGTTLPFGENPTGACTNDLPSSASDAAYLSACPNEI